MALPHYVTLSKDTYKAVRNCMEAFNVMHLFGIKTIGMIKNV